MSEPVKRVLGLSAAVVIAGAIGCSLLLSPQAEAPVDMKGDVDSGAQPASGPVRESETLSAVSLRQKFELPPPPEGADDQAGRIARDTQVYRRAQLLKVDAGTAYATWASAGDTVAANRNILPTLQKQPLQKLTFDGTRLSQLGALVAGAGPAHITVASRMIQADRALTVSGQNVVIDFAGAVIKAGPRPPLWMIELRKARNVAVTNANLTGGVNGILVDNGSDIALEGNEIHGLAQNGIVVTGESSVLNIDSNRLHDLGRAGIMLHGPVTRSLLAGNQIHHLRGHSNWMAGILLTGRKGDVSINPDAFFLPDRYWVVEEPIFQRLRNPEQNVVLGNIVTDGLSSGIYNDGGVANIFLGNRIERNSKEGICFDNGATANVFARNLVTGNGRRWGHPRATLALDSVLRAGVGRDGTAIAKLPGVSIDNALYNEIYDNDITGNWGGGVKMVRTSLFNVVGRNRLDDNNLGASTKAHFFGIELGAARADQPATDLDFVGSSGNIVFDNAIHGKHYSGIFIAKPSVQNYTFNNDIDGVEAFDVERPS